MSEEMNRPRPESQGQEQNRKTPAQEDAARGESKKPDAKKEEVRGKRKRKKVSADAINAIISSPTANVRSRRTTDTLSTTGNTTSYVGPTSNAPGGTGYNSGQPATGARINSTTSFEDGRVARSADDDEGDNNEKDSK